MPGDGRDVEHGQQPDLSAAGDMAGGVQGDRAGSFVAVYAAGNHAVEFGRPENMDPVGGAGFADGRDEFEGDHFAVAREAAPELADAAGLAGLYRDGAGKGEVGFRDDRFDGFGDAGQLPAEGGSDEVDRFRQADMTQPARLSAGFEFRESLPRADLLLEGHAAGRGVLNALHMDAFDIGGKAGKRRDAVVHQEAGIDPDRQRGQLSRLRRRRDFLRRVEVKRIRIEKFFAGRDHRHPFAEQSGDGVGRRVGVGYGGDHGDVGPHCESGRRTGDRYAAGGAAGGGSGVPPDEFRRGIDHGDEPEIGSGEQRFIEHPADLAESAKDEIELFHGVTVLLFCHIGNGTSKPFFSMENR